MIPVERAAAIVSHLEAADMHRSELEHERPFTWVRGDLKVQLVRNFHPFAKPPAELSGSLCGEPDARVWRHEEIAGYKMDALP